MGDYNPHIPQILGQEWVPIRNEDYNFNPNATTRETGYGFTLTAPRQVSTARFYVNNIEGRNFNNHVFGVNVYPRGQEALTGPIKTVVIPMNNGVLTGGPGGGGPFATLVGGSTLSECLAMAGDSKWAQFTTNTNLGNFESGRFDAFFAVNDYTPQLTGKRILNVSLLYAGQIFDTNSADGVNSFPAPYTGKNQAVQPTFVSYRIPGTAIEYGPNTTISTGFPWGLLGALKDLGGTVNQAAQSVQVINLGDFNPAITNAPTQGPWTLSQLRRLDARNGIDGFIFLLFQVPNSSYDVSPLIRIQLDYLALQVTYCEETRVISGASRLLNGYNDGLNIIPLADLSLASNPILAAGDYTVTFEALNPGDKAFLLDDLPGPYPGINTVREKYTLPSMPGIEVTVPFPLADHIGDTFTKTSTHLIPQVSLHASGAPLNEPHVYGRQIAAQIYGTITATQNLLDSAVGGAGSFPQVRFYARRFGNTTVPLTLTGASPTVSGSSTSISVSTFDALPEILDGWKEVTLRFNTPPSMGTGVTPSWTWSASGELAGNRWEVMGAMAPAVSGVPLNEYTNPAPAAQLLSPATYGQPSAGSTVNFTWMPGFSPPVSGATADQWSDAVLMFSQDTPSVTGFTLNTANQALTGVALNCASYPWYVPTSMAYNRLTFGAPPSGLKLSGNTNTYATTPDNAALDITGDIDIRADLSLQSWTPAAVASLVAKVTTTAAPIDNRSYWLRLETNGTLSLFWSTAGTAFLSASSTVPVPVTTGRLAVRATLDVDNGAAGKTVTFYTAPTINDTFVQLGSAVTTGGTTSIFSGGAPVEVGTVNGGTGNGAPSTFYAVEIRNLIGGTQVANPIFSAQPAGTTTFTDAAGRVWTMLGGYSFTNDLAYLELQRMDTISTDWATIAQITTPGITSFNDYEARVGIQSSYRIREVNQLLFAGPWSATLSNTFSAPGVTGFGMGADARTLLFTSNQAQNGARNLAYAIADTANNGQERFNFPEAGFTQFQFMYGRDYQTAFRPTERGGTTFSRTVLVQAAAISPPTLADFTSFRDLAWASLPYVCVRDEDGNRWFSNVAVPQGNVETNQRKIYLADITVTEVTATPAVTVV